MTEAKESSAYLGYISEIVLSSVFDNVERAPNNNPGWDFKCGKGKLIDAKAACLNKRGAGWQYSIRRNTIADYFLLLAFQDRKTLTPLHVWLVPGKLINHKTGITISRSLLSLDLWKKYEMPLDKIEMKCDSIRSNG
jgi:hypothetical protein